jgi:hypothetical protein
MDPVTVGVAVILSCLTVFAATVGFAALLLYAWTWFFVEGS